MMRIRHRLILMATLPAVLTSLMFAYIWLQIPAVVNNATHLFEERMSPVWLLNTISCRSVPLFSNAPRV